MWQFRVCIRRELPKKQKYHCSSVQGTRREHYASFHFGRSFISDTLYFSCALFVLTNLCFSLAEGGVTSATRFQSSVKFACAFSTARATPLKVHYPSKVIVGTLAATPRTQGEQRAKKIDAFNLRKVTISERMHKLGVKEADIIELFIKGGGAGGQKINKTNNCVLLKHIPSEIIIRCQKERSREQNRRIARRLLVEKLEKITLDKQRKEIEEFQKNLRRTRQPTESQKLRMRREKERRSQIKRQRASASSIIDF